MWRGRIVDQHSNTAQGCFRERNEITHPRLAAHISGKESRATTAALDQARCLQAASLVGV
jgi:hypothetical protein